jgi:hypothetical protein
VQSIEQSEPIKAADARTCLQTIRRYDRELLARPLKNSAAGIFIPTAAPVTVNHDQISSWQWLKTDSANPVRRKQ